MREKIKNLIINGQPNFRLTEEEIGEYLKKDIISQKDLDIYCWYVVVQTGWGLDHNMVKGRDWRYYLQHYNNWYKKKVENQAIKEIEGGKKLHALIIDGLKKTDCIFSVSKNTLISYNDCVGDWNGFVSQDVNAVIERWDRAFINDYGINNPNRPQSDCKWKISGDAILLQIWCHDKEAIEKVEDHKKEILDSFRRVKADEIDVEVDKIHGGYHIYNFRFWWD